jgi:hypothetical protein
MKWQMFYVTPGQSSRSVTQPVIRLHYLRDTNTSVGFVEQTQSIVGGPGTFRVFINGDEHATFDGIEVLDLEAGMALVKILTTNI